jgi:hypothetical protein
VGYLLERVSLGPGPSVDDHQSIPVNQVLLWVCQPTVDGYADTEDEKYGLAEDSNHSDDQSEDERQIQVGPVVVPVERLCLHLFHTAVFYHII